MQDDQKLVLDAVAEAQRILGEYNASGRSGADAHETLSMLSFVLSNRRDLEASINRLRCGNGMRFVS